MPYLYGLAKQCGYASNWTAISHPSLPNYLALAVGSTFGVTDDNSPSSHPESGPTVFGAAYTARRRGKSYQESMPANCSLSSSGSYAVKHNPWAYFTDERTRCQSDDVPSGTTTSGALHNDIAAGNRPSVGEVTPDLNNDAPDGTLTTADNWLKSWLPQVMAGPDYQAGRLVIVITGDEDNGSQGNKVLTTVISPR